MQVNYNTELDWMKELMTKTILDKLCEYYGVRLIDKLNLEAWYKFEIREKHLDPLVNEFQKNGISINKNLFKIYKDDTNTNWGAKSVNAPSTKTTDPEWQLEDNKWTPKRGDKKSWTKNTTKLWSKKK